MTPIILHLDAGRDTNGNPRRVYVILDPETRTIIETIDEGYRGLVGVPAAELAGGGVGG